MSFCSKILLERKVMFMNYAPLWIKTDYSILSSLIKIDDLIDILSSNNINVAAICDDNLYGVMEFYDKCKKSNITIYLVYITFYF